MCYLAAYWNPNPKMCNQIRGMVRNFIWGKGLQHTGQGQMTHPQLLVRVKCESQIENNGRTRSWSTFPSLQHYRGVEGRAKALEGTTKK